VTWRSKLSGCRRALLTALLFALALTGLRSFNTGASARPLRRSALDAWTRVAEPVDDRGEDWQPPGVHLVSLPATRSITTLQHASLVAVAHPQAPPPRIVRRLKLPPDGGDAVPPY
jgi:hypothetical protein